MRQIPLTPIRPTASIDEKIKWLIDAVQAISRGSHIPEDPENITGFDEAAQDAVGSIMTDSADLDFTYTDATPAITAIIKTDAVDFAQMQNITSDRLIGRDTASSGDPEEIAVTNGLEFTGSQQVGIANNGVTFARMQDITSDRLIGRDTASSGDPEEVSVGSGLEFTGGPGIGIANNGVTNARLNDMAAWTVKVRNAGTTGDPSDAALADITEETAPASGDFLLGFLASAEIRKFDVGNLPNVPTLIASGAISSVASVDIALDGDTWDEVEITFIDVVPATDNVDFNLRFDQGAGFLSGASDYQWAYTIGGTARTDAADSEITLADGVGSSTNERLSFKLHLYRPGDADLIKAAHWHGGYRAQSATPFNLQGWGELILNDNAITDAQFLCSSGNIASGYYYAIGKKFS